MKTKTPSYQRHRFPSDIISHAVWLYHRFCLSFREVEELLAERYCQLKSDWADFLPRTSNLNAEQSMSDEFVYCVIFSQIHLT
jgi:hypothetical protein